MTQTTEFQAACEREARRQAKIKAQHEAYERAYAECAKQVGNEAWFLRKTLDEQERHLASMAVEKFLQGGCARS